MYLRLLNSTQNDTNTFKLKYQFVEEMLNQGKLKGKVTVQLTSSLTDLDWSVLQIKTKIVSCHTADSKPVKQEVNCTMILPPLVFPTPWLKLSITFSWDQIHVKHRYYFVNT
jgi:hypothetical protein